VTTTVSGPLAPCENVTVVSSVLGRQLENSHASSRSRIFAEMVSIAPSTALLRKRRADGSGRLEIYLVCAIVWRTGTAEDTAMQAAPLTNWRREMTGPEVIERSLPKI